MSIPNFPEIRDFQNGPERWHTELALLEPLDACEREREVEQLRLRVRGIVVRMNVNMKSNSSTSTSTSSGAHNGSSSTPCYFYHIG